MKKIFTLIILISILCLSGCNAIRVGGSGRVGDVSGSGEVIIPVPDRN
ncbi:MAG: hypothetical protein ABH815_02745 [Candidatus Omnitrophota bacterium]